MREISPHDLAVGDLILTADGDPVGVVKRITRLNSSSFGADPLPNVVVTFPSGIDGALGVNEDTRLFIAEATDA